MQKIVDELFGMILSSKDDQLLFNSTLRQLDTIYEDMHAGAILEHGTKLFTDLHTLLDVSSLLYVLSNIQVSP